jgi:hypothetical protein
LQKASNRQAAQAGADQRDLRFSIHLICSRQGPPPRPIPLRAHPLLAVASAVVDEGLPATIWTIDRAGVGEGNTKM